MRARAVPLLAYFSIIACTSQSAAKLAGPENTPSEDELNASRAMEMMAQAKADVDRTTTVVASAMDLLGAITSPVVPVTPSSCKAGMIEVEGEYCPNVMETCLYWVDSAGHRSEAAKPSKKFPTGRCGEWKYPATCLTPVAKRPHKHFCIDEYEYPNVAGQRPQSWMSWYDVKAACEAEGKRLCTKEEWTFACEGPDMQPYPYAGPGEHPGYTRDKNSCNFDNSIPEDPLKPIDKKTGKHGRISVFDSRRPGDRVSTILDDLLAPAGSMPACVSPFGVHDMVGNIDEFIDNTAIPEHSPKAPYRSGLMSGHVFGVRNQCRAITDGHNEWFGWYETGGRCCDATTKETP